jgi:hypothetical protein
LGDAVLDMIITMHLLGEAADKAATGCTDTGQRSPSAAVDTCALGIKSSREPRLESLLGDALM